MSRPRRSRLATRARAISRPVDIEVPESRRKAAPYIGQTWWPAPHSSSPRGRGRCWAWLGRGASA
eukprot:473901-Pyramimonas_sp.AAC.1